MLLPRNREANPSNIRPEYKPDCRGRNDSVRGITYINPDLTTPKAVQSLHKDGIEAKLK